MKSSIRILGAPLVVLSLTACGGSGSPIDQQIGEGRIVVQVGPGGRTLRGDGGTDLEGFLLDIPPGALDRLVEVRIEPGPDIEVPDTSRQTPTYSIQLRPDPGVLRVPALLQVTFDLPIFRQPGDLVVVSRPPEDRPTAIASLGATARWNVAADTGSYDRETDSFVAEIGSLSDLQVRILDRPRLGADSIRLVQLGFTSLSRLTDASLVEADLLFAEAQQADPFSPAANLFRAVSRVLVALNDRTDDTVGLDSVGEALQRIGFDVQGRSLATRLRTGVWPGRVEVPPGAPTDREILSLLRTRLVPALELALADLDRVTSTAQLIVVLPSLITSLPGDREVDAADVLFLRALLSAAVTFVEMANDLDLAFDAFGVTRRNAPPTSLEQSLGVAPGFGRLLEAPDARTIEALRATLFLVIETLDSLSTEPDDQSDDLLVFPRSFTPERFDRWRANLRGLDSALAEGSATRLVLGSNSGSLLVSPLGPLENGRLDPRGLTPLLFRFLPLAGTLPDPSAGGTFPELDQDRATELLGLSDRHLAPQGTVVADGRFDDWPIAALALDPVDPVGDVRGPSSLRATDLERVWFLESPDELALRIDVADGPITARGSQATAYAVSIRNVGTTGFEARIDVELIPVSGGGIDVVVRRDGVVRTVRAEVAANGDSLEVVLDRFQLLDPDEPVNDRLVRVRSESLSLGSPERAADEMRGFLVRF